MFKDYDKAKKMLKGSFDHIIGLMDKRYVTYDEIKDLMVQALYELSKENEKIDVQRISMPQVLYGPPPAMKEERVVVEKIDMPQVLYGPPPAMKSERVVVERVDMPQVLYGPPPAMKSERVEVRPVPKMGVLYGPPQLNRTEMDSMLNDDYIPGTNVRKPRPKNPGETDDEYLDYLDRYYGQYFNNGKGKGAGK